jgi:hypothetical protein
VKTYQRTLVLDHGTLREQQWSDVRPTTLTVTAYTDDPGQHHGLGLNLTVLSRKESDTGHCLSQEKSTFQHLSISSDAFFDTICPKPLL